MGSFSFVFLHWLFLIVYPFPSHYYSPLFLVSLCSFSCNFHCIVRFLCLFLFLAVFFGFCLHFSHNAFSSHCLNFFFWMSRPSFHSCRYLLSISLGQHLPRLYLYWECAMNANCNILDKVKKITITIIRMSSWKTAIQCESAWYGRKNGIGWFYKMYGKRKMPEQTETDIEVDWMRMKEMKILWERKGERSVKTTTKDDACKKKVESRRQN